MNTMHKKNKIAIAVSCAYVSLALTPVYASDTEIYTQTANNKNESPVVMMMLDTSGSMRNCMTSSSSCNSPNRRQDALKKAVNAVLNGDTGTVPVTKPADGKVKIGLATYQLSISNASSISDLEAYSGGLIRYPARPLDAIPTINPDGYVSSTGTSSSTLTISNTAVGLYFPNVLIPRNAKVTSADITFKANANSTAATTKWSVGVENTGNAASFALVPLVSRSFITPTPAPTEIDMPSWTAGSSNKIDVTALVQNIANKAEWCGGNGMAFSLADTLGNTRDASNAILTVNLTIDKAASTCIVLGSTTESTTNFALAGKLDDVTWPANATSGAQVTSTTTPTPINKVTSGVKTQAVARLSNATAIPAGSLITSATLNITPTANSTAKLTTIKLFNNAAFPVICTATSTCILPSLLTTNFVTPTATLNKNLVAGRTESIDVTDLIKALPAGALSSVGVLMESADTASGTTTIYAADKLGVTKAQKVNLDIKWKLKTEDLSSQSTVRQELTSVVNGLTFTNSTPLGAAYVETSRYMYGLVPYYNTPTYIAPDSRAVDSVSGKYISPLASSSSCSNNYIFMLTDGAPTVTAKVIDNATNITGAAKEPVVASVSTTGVDCPTTDHLEALPAEAKTVPQVKAMIKNNTSGSYTEDVALEPSTLAKSGSKAATWLCSSYIASVNKSPSKRPTSLAGIVAPIKTSTVILGPEGDESETEMKRVAQIGGGQYTKAGNTQALVDALSNVINKAVEGENVLASPGVAINQFNRLNTLDQVYYVLFNPTQTKRWDGNIKKYRLDVSSQTIKDMNGASAIAADGSFEKTSKSYWLGTTEAADGASVVAGGAASKLPLPSVRKIYSYTGATPAGNLTVLDPTDSATKTAFTSPATPPVAESTAAVTDLINWYKGYDIVVGSPTTTTAKSVTSATARQRLAGGLHSKAVLVNYGFTGAATDALDASKQANMLYYSTLDSMLHGINTATGVEEFAFVPSQKLATIRTLYDNATGVPAEPEYGMDLTWTVYRKDGNGDGQIDAAGDKVYLYGGMRMGGRNYYGLDLTTINPKKCPSTSTTPCVTPAPKILFSILGGTTAGFERLGQTWSQPVVADIKVNGVVTPVLIFAGGYDASYENCYTDTACSTLAPEPLGNSLYIVNAENGAKIWSASSTTGADLVVSDMKYSIPSQPKVLDVNSDGLADTIYVGDLGGQVFRVDINNKNTTESDGPTLVKRVRLLAQLGSSGVAAPAATGDHRRIYEPPTVAFFKDATLGSIFATVAVGTGNRSHPLSTSPLIKDRFATVFDFDVTRTDLLSIADTKLQDTIKYANLTAITGLEDTASTTSGAITYSTDATTGKKSPTKFGWYVDLISTGEKSLASGLIYLNKLTFTTYSPTATTTGCSVSVGTTNLYEMCMPYGTQCTDDTTVARRQANYVSGLGAEPQVVVQPSGVLADGSPTAENDLGVLVKTKLKKKKSGGKKVFTPLHHWREKTRYPAK